MPPRTPLLRPDAYFDRRRSPLLPGLGVFAVYAIGIVVSIYATASLLLDRIANPPAGIERALYGALGTLAVLTLVLGVIGLLLVAAIMHFMVGGSGTAGRYGDAVAVAGWAYAPNALAVPVNYLLARRELGRLSFDGSDPAALQAQLEAAQDPSGIAPILLALLVIAWSVYVLAVGVAETHDVEVADSIVPALVVGVGAFILSVI